MKITTKMANGLCLAAQKYEEKYTSANPRDASIYRQDADDLRSIAKMIENGESPKAVMAAMSNLDTIVRDQIPDDIYDAVYVCR